MLQAEADAVTGLVTIDFPTWTQEFVDIRVLAEIRARESCHENVPETAQGDNCDDPALFDSDPGTPEVEPPPMYLGNIAGETWCTMARVVEEGTMLSCKAMPSDYGVFRNPNSGVYEIDSETFDHYLDNPMCLLEESSRITLNSAGEYQFSNVGQQGLLRSLGLRNSDVPLSVNSLGLDTPAQAVAAYANVSGESAWTLKVRRGSSNVVLRYELVD